MLSHINDNLTSASIKGKKMKILMVSYCFPPQQNPRAFRTFELARELSKQGHTVTVIIPALDIDVNKYKSEYDLDIKMVGTYHKTAKEQKKKGKLIHLLDKVIHYFIGGKKMVYSIPLSKRLLKVNEQYDLLISLSAPFVVHLGTWLAQKKRKLASVSIADCGDPFYENPSNRHFILLKYLEKMVLNSFDFVTIPTEVAHKTYSKMVAQSKIRVIPQGFNFNDVRIAEYVTNEVPTFAYAGAFYEKIRNPRCLFEYLCKINEEFKFVLYIDKKNAQTMNCISPYIDKLGGKLELRNIIPRLDCLFELSKMDFLINISNLGSVQVPSKLIDYALIKRPVFSFNQENFAFESLEEFLNGNYNIRDLGVNLDSFDISKIAEKFLSLGKT